MDGTGGLITPIFGTPIFAAAPLLGAALFSLGLAGPVKRRLRAA